MPAAINRVGEFVVRWGESLRWDDVRQRLYFVDCAKKTLHWLEGGEPPLHTLQLDSLPTGLVLTGGRQLVICLDGGLHVVDPDAGTSDLLVAYPDGMYGRANDANADDSGNLVTGTLNLGPGPGAFWWFSVSDGWRLLDDGIGNANGPVVVDVDGQSTLVFADTLARSIYAYDYRGRNRRSATLVRRPQHARWRTRWSNCRLRRRRMELRAAQRQARTVHGHRTRPALGSSDAEPE